MRLQSDTADTIVWSKYATPPPYSTNPVLRHALARFQTLVPLHAALRHARTLRETSPRLLIVAGRLRRLPNESQGRA